MISTLLALPDGQYVKQATPKTGIVLHFTAGSTAAGAVASWKADNAIVSTAYLLDRDGTIYEAFDPQYWSWHLGLQGKFHRGGAVDRKTIGIEIVNMGPLVRRENMMCSWPKDFNQRYCDASERDRYVECQKYRGYTAFAAFTPQQYVALPQLIDMLTSRFNIPRGFLPKDQRLEFCPEQAVDFAGITTHVNYRADKFDIGPAFDWASIIAA